MPSLAPKEVSNYTTHNEIRDLTASLLMEVCHQVSVEPNLLPITGEPSMGLHPSFRMGLDWTFPMNGLRGGRHEKTFCDVRVFNPHAEEPILRSSTGNMKGLK